MAERDGKGEKLTLIEWLGYRKDANFENGRGIGIAIGFFLFAVTLALLPLIPIAIVGMYASMIQVFDSLEAADAGNALRGLAFALGAIVGMPFLVWRSWVAHRQADTAEQGLITDRFTRAVEQLGAHKTVKQQRRNKAGDLQFMRNNQGKIDYKQPLFEEITVENIEVRLGALYALERISQDSERDNIQIMEIICAYLRENSRKAEKPT